MGFLCHFKQAQASLTRYYLLSFFNNFVFSVAAIAPSIAVSALVARASQLRYLIVQIVTTTLLLPPSSVENSGVPKFFV